MLSRALCLWYIFFILLGSRQLAIKVISVKHKHAAYLCTRFFPTRHLVQIIPATDAAGRSFDSSARNGGKITPDIRDSRNHSVPREPDFASKETVCSGKIVIKDGNRLRYRSPF